MADRSHGTPSLRGGKTENQNKNKNFELESLVSDNLNHFLNHLYNLFT